MTDNVGQKQYKIAVRIDEPQMEVLRRIKRTSGSTNLSDCVRQCMRFANVIFDERITIEDAIIPEMMDVILQDENFRKKTPFIHVLKQTYQLEDILYPQHRD